MTVEQNLSFSRRPHATPVAAEARAELLKNPGFGRVFTEHMVTIRWTEGRGWHDARGARARALPARSGQRRAALRAGDFRGTEGLSHAATASRCSVRSQRAPVPGIGRAAWRCRACRRRCSSRRVEELVRIDRDWIPGGEGSLYLRPFMFASEVFLGVKPSAEYLFVVIASPVGSYFKGGKKAVIDLGVGQLHPRRDRRHRRGQMRRQLRREPARAGRGDRSRLRSGGVPRRGRAPLGRGTRRHEHLLRVRRRLAADAAARRHDPARHHPRFASSRSPAAEGRDGARGALQHRPVAHGRRQRQAERSVRLRHGGGGLADRRDQVEPTATSSLAMAAAARSPTVSRPNWWASSAAMSRTTRAGCAKSCDPFALAEARVGATESSIACPEGRRRRAFGRAPRRSGRRRNPARPHLADKPDLASARPGNFLCRRFFPIDRAGMHLGALWFMNSQFLGIGR